MAVEKQDIGIGISNENFFAEIKDVKELVKESLKRILLTRKFERPNNPDFGVGVQKYLFADTDLIKDEIKEEIKEQIERYEPRIEVNTNDIFVEKQVFNDSTKTYIKISYKIRTLYGEEDNIELELSV